LFQEKIDMAGEGLDAPAPSRFVAGGRFAKQNADLKAQFL
jgi:hypothetical protein